jgi:hypothetical protein
MKPVLGGAAVSLASDPRSRPGLWLAAVLIAGVMLCAPARAQSGAAESGLQFEFTPYLWMAGLKGTTGIGSLTASGVEVSFSDILEMFEFGLMGTFEARKGRWGFLADAMYLKVSDSATRQVTVGPGLGLGPGPTTLTANVSFELVSQTYQFAGAYRLSEGLTAWDAIGGVRYNSIEPEIQLVGTATGTHVRSRKEDWWDAFVGFRVKHPLSARWSLVGYGDAGGGSSDSTWQLLASLNYDYSKSTSIKISYRHYAVDYNKGDFRYDMETAGPMIGVGIRF